VITVELPAKVDASSVAVELRCGDPTIVVGRLDRELPFLAGATSAPLSKFDRQVKDRELILTFTKESPGEWQRFITAPIPDSDFVIDPLSAFQISVHALGMAESPDFPEETQQMLSQEGLVYLTCAVASNFPPALVWHGINLAHTGTPDNLEHAARVFRIASEYGSAQADCLLGMLAVRREDFTDAITHFRKGADAGDLMAQNCLGEIYSPFEGGVSGFEDPQKAFEIFSEILAHNPDHGFALYNLAQMYKNGNPVAKDVKRARELYAAAKKADPQVPDIAFEEVAEGWPKTAVVAVAVAGLAAGATAVWWWLRRSRRAGAPSL
jgi:tetratricopeptide (TPR) repeat protein